jgi:hypothetical protein
MYSVSHKVLAKTLSCGGGHLETKKTRGRLQHEDHFSQISCQMVQWFQMINIFSNRVPC